MVWTIRKNDAIRITTLDIRFMRCTVDRTKWVHKLNEKIRKQLKTGPLLWYMGKERQNWRDHVNRMDGRRIPIQILQCISQGRWSVGHLAKRLLESVSDDIVLTHVWKMISYIATERWITFSLFVFSPIEYLPVSTFKILHTILLSHCIIYFLQCMCLASLMTKVNILQYFLQRIFMALLLLVQLYSLIICSESFHYPFFVSGHRSVSVGTIRTMKTQLLIWTKWWRYYSIKYFRLFLLLSLLGVTFRLFLILSLLGVTFRLFLILSLLGVTWPSTNEVSSITSLSSLLSGLNNLMRRNF